MNASVATQAATRQLQQVLLPDDLLTDSGEVAGYMTDQRRVYQGRAFAVALPANVAQVQAVMAICQQHRVGVVPQGGNTGYSGGATPDGSGTQLLLSLKHLNTIRAVNPAGFSMTVEAGCVLADVQQAADSVERFFPLSLGSEGSCQIGGNIATNAGGLNVLRFGMMRELVLGVEAVLPDGRLYQGLGELRKDNTGYDLSSLLVGSEGTLAVVTAASLKLWPAMRHSATALVAIKRTEDALMMLDSLRARVGDRLTSLEYLPQAVLKLLQATLPEIRQPFAEPPPGCLLIELSSGADEDLRALLQSTLQQCLSNQLTIDAALAQSERERAEFWRLRESIPELQLRLGPSIKHDVSLPLQQLPTFISRVQHWVEEQAPEGQLICYGHVGDGNLHCNLSPRSGTDIARFQAREAAIHRAVHDLAHELGGSISAEHGIGQSKIEELRRYASPVKLALMRQIKNALDPNGIMNPGKLL